MIQAVFGFLMMQLLNSSPLRAADAVPIPQAGPCQKQQNFAAIVHGGAGDWDVNYRYP